MNNAMKTLQGEFQPALGQVIEDCYREETVTFLGYESPSMGIVQYEDGSIVTVDFCTPQFDYVCS